MNEWKNDVRDFGGIGVARTGAVWDIADLRLSIDPSQLTLPLSDIRRLSDEMITRRPLHRLQKKVVVG
jgi:hypothetical protein